VTTFEPRTVAHPGDVAPLDDADHPSDEPLLLQAVRDGTSGAFGVLYTRYRAYAVAVAHRELGPGGEPTAEDIAEVAFLRVLGALRNGRGPTDALPAYLATTVRREVWRAKRRLRRQAEVVDRWAGEVERLEGGRLEDGGGPPSTIGDLGAHALLGEAFGDLSDRWRHVLWLTEVEGRKPAEVAPLLGLSAGSVSALAYRARNGLLAAYLAAYRRAAPADACRSLADDLGRYLAAGSPPDGFGEVVGHLDRCPTCRAVTRGVDVISG